MGSVPKYFGLNFASDVIFGLQGLRMCEINKVPSGSDDCNVYPLIQKR